MVIDAAALLVTVVSQNVTGTVAALEDAATALLLGIHWSAVPLPVTVGAVMAGAVRVLLVRVWDAVVPTTC